MNNKAKLVYQRILLKLSGEAFLDTQKFGIDATILQQLSNNIKELMQLGVEIGIVLGGGNFLRGAKLEQAGFDRVTSDQMGMLATVMNGLALRNSLLNLDVATHVMSAVQVHGFVETYDRCLAKDYLRKGAVIIFVGGTGCPLFTTDSAAALRGIEIDADVILKATKVDGVYSADPQIDSAATLYSSLTYQEALEKELAIMDLTAFSLCRDHNKVLQVFNMHKPHVLRDIVLGKVVGTIVQNGS
jgi:uridylate kinase